MNKNIIIWDLDGTLACGQHRLHLLPAKEVADKTWAWDEFNLAASGDAVIEDNVALLKQLSLAGYMTIILTGRGDVAKEITEQWLYDNTLSLFIDKIIMRPATDHRKDTEFKEEKLREIGLDKILCCFDDLEHVAKHIRSLGVTCHLVTHYDTPKVHTEERK